MDCFEGVVATLLESQGYWVRRSFKVNLTTEEKRAIELPSMPRPELDLLALNMAENELVVFEVKSFLDSPGVKLQDLDERHGIPKGRYKLFTSKRYREIIFNRLREDLMLINMVTKGIKISLGLAAGNVYQGRSDDLMKFMLKNGWKYISPKDIRAGVEKLSQQGYSNDPTMITAKILLRDCINPGT